jgi:hypothetical protein
MSFFRNMNDVETNDIAKYPAYASLPEDVRKEVNDIYESVYNNNQQRMGIRIAQGIAFETAKQLVEVFVAEKHIGFKKLVGKLEAGGKSAAYAGAIAHKVGVEKYGAKAMKSAAKNHHSLGEDEESSSPDMMGETDIEFKDPEADYAKNPKGATYEGEILNKMKGVVNKVANKVVPKRRRAQAQIKRVMGEGEIGFNNPQADYANNPEGATYEGEAANFQDANDAMVGMTEDEKAKNTCTTKNCPCSYCPTCGGSSGNMPKSCNGSMCMCPTSKNEADDFGVTQQAHIPTAYPQTPGGDADVISHASAIMYNPANAFSNMQADPEDKGPKAIQKANNRMKGMNDTASQNEEVDPIIAAAAGYIKHRAEVAGLMESVDPKKKVSAIVEDVSDDKAALMRSSRSQGLAVGKFKPTKDCVSSCHDNEKHSPMCQHYSGPDSHNDMAEEEIVEAFNEIGHGDTVHIKTPQGQTQRGKAVMRSSHGGWVLNMGGKHGTPGLVDEKNYVKHTAAKKKTGFPGDKPGGVKTESVTISQEYAKLMAEGLTADQKKKLKDPICNNCGKVAAEHPNEKCKQHVKWNVGMVGKKK